MGIKVAATCLHWSQSVAPHSPTSSQTLASAISTISSPSKRRKGSDRGLICRFIHLGHQSALFGTNSTKLLRSRSCDNHKTRRQTIRRSCSACLNGSSDEEFADEIKELALRFKLASEDAIKNSTDSEESELFSADSRDKEDESCDYNIVQIPEQFPSSNPNWIGIQLDWPERDEIVSDNIERKANSVDFPISLRMIKKKKQWQEGLIEAGESAYSSIKKAFSSMVFIIHELHSYSLKMREYLYYEDLEEILVRVRKEMHASFVWLFEQVFSHTPTLMVYIMILLANFTVSSLATNIGIAVASPPPATLETVSMAENQNLQWTKKFDSSAAIKSFTLSSSSFGKTTSIGGNDGNGGKVKPVSSGTDGGDRRSSSSNLHRTIVSDEISRVSSFGKELGSELKSEEELKLWNSITEEASRMRQEGLRYEEGLDQETMQRFISPVIAVIEGDDYSDYFRVELLYQMALSQEPNNPLILSNYAQFLHLVVHDHDRAEELFKRAIRVEPADAESFDRYAKFLWLVRKDLEAAEETYLEAISADPGNSYYAANYAHFLWNTGGEDTCYPLNSPDDNDA